MCAPYGEGMVEEGPWHRRCWVAVDMVIATAFVLLDTGTTLVGATWWPQHPGALAWVVLSAQALAGGMPAVRRISPLTVVGVLA